VETKIKLHDYSIHNSNIEYYVHLHARGLIRRKTFLFDIIFVYEIISPYNAISHYIMSNVKRN